MNFGILGCGGIADRRTIPGMIKSDKVRIVAVEDVSEEITKSIAQKYEVETTYTNEDELFRDDAIDAVYIGSPAHVHMDQVRKAADAGKHILCEKPLTISVKETEKTIDYCEGKGDPVMGRGQLTCWYPPMEGVWRQDPSRGGGGALMDMAIHTVDILRYLFGEVEAVSSFNGTETHGYDVEDSGVILLKFKNRAYGVCDSFFNIPDEAAKGVLEVYGTRGSLMAEGTISQVAGGRMMAYLQKEGKGYDAQQERIGIKPEEIKAELKNMYLAEVEDFIDAVEKKRRPMNSGEEALRNFQIIQAAYRSQKTGKVVKL
jgi:predicted dehydrogenase